MKFNVIILLFFDDSVESFNNWACLAEIFKAATLSLTATFQMQDFRDEH